MNGDYIFHLLIVLIINVIISYLASWLIPNAYLAAMVTSIIVAFSYACVTYRGKSKLKNEAFWSSFLLLAIIFLILDMFVWWISGLI